GMLLPDCLSLVGLDPSGWLPPGWAAANWTPTERIVVTTVRLPRVLMAGIAGAGLALSGAVLQGMFRNPLVGPQTIGAASGASLGGVVAILLFGFGLPVHLGAFCGAALALAAVLLVHRGDGVSPVLTLVLAGVVVGAFCGALVGFVTFIADPEVKLPGIVFWLLGSFAAASWPNLALLAACTIAGGGVMLAMRWRVNVLSLGDEEARALGVEPGRDRVILLAATCLAISAQVAVSGTIGWVGLVIPNLVRMVVGADHRRLLPVSAVAGAAFLMSADTLARDLSAAEIPVGIVTAIVGTPVFAWLLRRHARGQAA
ncbi:iron ABC transporter permease, partial [Rhodopseudomonas sp. WA056]|uniref:FecCD family ABC transporter permease n=1 Tax=Rhodopseudomonas sp. WA056 TaxID=2269367 RepID=UPI0013DE9415